jgi:hypothetical protein
MNMNRECDDPRFLSAGSRKSFCGMCGLRAGRKIGSYLLAGGHDYKTI